ncbi:FAD/NAD(P)-binding oxidoreductase [Myroides odoratus]|uniref:Sulfide dehydrogenase [flavocytochrome c] flavoprotein chain n=1 Tax=Myroides odoratus TaxID=256 RepID=A0A378U516_MYROD|nr:FAD/NAD(P)-binding oxidoreductase [Myroides odoratus]QQU02580.1 NAD(P)/FAD-dependent oxidoreductase [Myroides odoratus]STZ70206.1 Sulfide dehydrogenase [flavocytochrome c] flavoprotein chain precursor [Myroides odoratus]
MKTHYQILIIGAGTAGIMTAAQLKKKDSSLDIALVDPATDHYYQPAWTLVGAGAYDKKKTIKPMASLIPPGVTWIKEAVTGFDAEHHAITTTQTGTLTYEYLVVCPGLVNDYSLIEGLAEAVEQGVVCSNYIDPEYTWKQLQAFQGGTAIFTQPSTPIKCGGAPQKIMYLACDYFKKKGINTKTKVYFPMPGSVIFGVKKIADTLLKVIDRYQIDFMPLHNPIRIDAAAKIAYFKPTNAQDNHCFVTSDDQQTQVLADGVVAMPFDFLHLAPPQTAPKFVQTSNLVNAAGWLDVNHHSLQHNKYKNIFGLGDVAGLPTAKTGAAIRKQVPVVVDNLMRLLQNQEASNTDYNGYSSCPLVTGYGKMVLAEFNYKNEFIPDPKLKQMLVFSSHKEHWRLWMLKKHLLPYLYWSKMMKGEQV